MDTVPTFDSYSEGDERYLAWVKEKHVSEGADFADKLVKALREEFGRHPPLSENDRATLYKQVRLRLNSEHVASRGLKSLAKREINS